MDQFGHARPGGIGAILQNENREPHRLRGPGHDPGPHPGGTPHFYDRVLATRFGVEAIDACVRGPTSYVSGQTIGKRLWWVDAEAEVHSVDQDRLRCHWADARAILAACAEHDVEGIVLKRLASRYRLGERSRLGRKVKVRGWAMVHAHRRRPA